MAQLISANNQIGIPDVGKVYVPTNPQGINPVAYYRSGNNVTKFDLTNLVKTLSGAQAKAQYGDAIKMPGNDYYIDSNGTPQAITNAGQLWSEAVNRFNQQTGLDYYNLDQQNTADLESAFGGVGGTTTAVNDFNAFNTLLKGTPQAGGNIDISQGQKVNAQGQLVDATGKVIANSVVNPNQGPYTAPNIPTNPMAQGLGPDNLPPNPTQAQVQQLQQQAQAGQPTQPQSAPTGQNQGAGAGVIPSTALQPGASGIEVQRLQNFLVSQGLMSQADLAGGYGTYGPKTTAAVAALQQKLGVDNSSGVGFFGPRTIAALSQGGASNPNTGASGATTYGSAPAGSTTGSTGNDPYANLDPIAKQVKMYTDTYNALGLNTIKQQYDKYLKDQADLNNEMNDKIRETNNNPWLSEGVRVRTNEKIKEKYQSRLEVLSNLLNLTDSLYKQGQAQVENIVSGAQADMRAANELAQKQIDAEAKLAEADNQVVEANGRKLLVDTKTGKIVADLGAANAGGGGGNTDGYTSAQLKALTKLNQDVSKNSTYSKTTSMRNYGDNVIASLSQGTGVGDIAAINQFQKVIDEGAVTRDQDVKLIQGAQSLANQLKTQISKLESGQQLSSTQRQQMRTLVEKMYDAQITALERDPYIQAKNKEAELYGLTSGDTILGELGGFRTGEKSYPPGTIVVDDEAHIQYLIGSDGISKTPIGSSL